MVARTSSLVNNRRRTTQGKDYLVSVLLDRIPQLTEDQVNVTEDQVSAAIRWTIVIGQESKVTSSQVMSICSSEKYKRNVYETTGARIGSVDIRVAIPDTTGSMIHDEPAGCDASGKVQGTFAWVCGREKQCQCLNGQAAKGVNCPIDAGDIKCASDGDEEIPTSAQDVSASTGSNPDNNLLPIVVTAVAGVVFVCLGGRSTP